MSDDKSIIERQASAERFERFVTLEAGQFWKVIDASAYDEVDEGETLLVFDVDYVDNAPHTIIVRKHPSKIRQYRSDTFKVLVQDFLNDFEHVDIKDAEKTREEEQQAIHGRMAHEQEELTKACSDSALLDNLVQRDMPEEEKQAQLPVIRQQLPNSVVGAIKSQSVSALMVQGLNQDGVEQIKGALEHQRDVNVKRSEWITQKTMALSAIASELTPYFQEKAAIALAATTGMTKKVAELMEGIGSLNLYTLKDVEINTLVEGQGAPSSEPLTIAQRILYMDEELAVWADMVRNWDCRNRDQFYEELKANKELVRQIFPTERCVVGMATTRDNHDYSSYHVMQAAQLKRENATVFFLVRNGDNIHVVLSGDAVHHCVRRLFPSMGDLDTPFRGMKGETITYNDIRYTSSLSEHDAMALTYKRILILFAGLDHNKQLFGDFYDEEPSMNFVTSAFQDRYFNFIYDEDGTNVLAYNKRKSIHQWMKDMNESITVGSTVLIDWSLAASPDSIPTAYNRNARYDEYPDQRYSPTDQSDFVKAVVINYQGRLAVKIHVEGYNAQYESRNFHAYMYINEAIRASNKISGVVCLDRIQPEDLEFYLHNRPARELNVSGILAVKEILKITREIYAKEYPIRHRLYNALVDGGIASGTDALKLVADAVAIARCANKGADLADIISSEDKYNALLNSMFTMSGTAGDPVQEIIKLEESLGRTVIRVSIDAKGTYQAFSTPLESERDDRLVPFTWQVRTSYKGVRALKPSKPLMVRLEKAPSSESVKFEIEDVTPYVFDENSPWKTPKAKAKFLDEDYGSASFLSKLRENRDDVEFVKFMLNMYHDARCEVSSKGYVTEPSLFIPLGTYLHRHQPMVVGFYLDALQFLCWLAGDTKEYIDCAKKVYSGAYKLAEERKVSFMRELDRHAGRDIFNMFKVVMVYPEQLKDGEGWFIGRYADVCSPVAAKAYSKTATIEKFMEEHAFNFVDGITADLDAQFGITQPEAYGMYVVEKIPESMRQNQHRRDQAIFKVDEEFVEWEKQNLRSGHQHKIFESVREARHEILRINSYVCDSKNNSILGSWDLEEDLVFEIEMAERKFKSVEVYHYDNPLYHDQ